MSTSGTTRTVVDLTGTNEKSDRSMLVDLKNGKLLLKQKPMSLEKMSETMQEIVRFREFIEGKSERNELPLTSIPDEHLPLIAKLVQESDKTLHALAKSVQNELVPTHDNDGVVVDASSTLPLDAIEQAVKAVATRCNYGLESTNVASKVPAALHAWRWEVKEDCSDWLPKVAKDKLDVRLAERRQAKQDAQELFDTLSEDVRSSLLGTKTITRTPLKTKPSVQITGDVAKSDHGNTDSKEQPSSQDVNANGDVTSTPKAQGRPRKPVDPEKAAKEKERLEKKAAKAEKEKKEQDAQNKSRSILASFFGKQKAPPPKRTVSSTSAKVDSAEPAGPSTSQSDFAKTFKPFVLKKDAEIAPINWFEQAWKRRCMSRPRTEGNVIVLDDSEESATPEASSSQDLDLGQLDASERLHRMISQPRISLNPIPSRRHPRSHLKTYCPQSVKAIMVELSEAEVTGDDDKVRALLALLRDRRAIPAKVLIFEEDARPGYFGTWTRSSHAVGPRTPFTRDVLALDYSYDSAEEWEGEEEAGGDDVVEDAEEEDAGDGDDDSDMDEWLVDDEEAEDPGTPVDDREESPDLMLVDVAYAPAKRKSAPESGKQGKKRKVVVPLVPFTKGPCWESTVGLCTYEPFDSYRIELFNDTSYPIDPFTYVAAPVEVSSSSTAAKGRADFAVPALPTRLTGASIQAATPADATSSTPAGPKKPVLAPKTAYPEALLPVLLSKITALATSNLAFIVETVYQDVREHRVKKNSIEAKIKEVGEKCKTQKVWVVKPDVKAAYGLT